MTSISDGKFTETEGWVIYYKILFFCPEKLKIADLGIAQKRDLMLNGDIACFWA